MFKAGAIIVATGFLSWVGSSYALDFDFVGAFSKDKDIATFNFTVGTDSAISIYSSSWKENNGFEPLLTIFTEDGTKINQAWGYDYPDDLDFNYNAYINELDAGNYIATVTQFYNISKSDYLTEGFEYDNNPHFTSDPNYTLGVYTATQLDFNGTDGSARNGSYSIHFLNVVAATQATQVPDGGSSLGLLSLGLFGIGTLRRNKNQHITDR